MEKLFFTMTPEYTMNWGLWEGLRELLQNSLDELDQGAEMKVFYENDTLYIRTMGEEIGADSFLLGESGKREIEGLRGKHGEGLTLGLMALCRAGIKVWVKSGDYSWEPSFEMVDTLNGFVINRDLFCLTQKPVNERYTQEVLVGICLPPDVWEEYKLKFLPLVEETIPMDKFHKAPMGTLILDKRFSGMLYSKGIYVQTRDDFEYGYDLNNLTLDRDRNMLPDFDVKWEAGQVLSHYERASKSRVVYDLILQEKPECTFPNLSSDGYERLGKFFQDDNGEDAVPVISEEESSVVRRAGKVPVIVCGKVKESLKKSKVPAVSDLENDYSVQVVRTIPGNEVTDSQSEVLDYLLESYFNMTRSIANILPQEVNKEFVDFLLSVRFSVDVVELSREEAYYCIDYDNNIIGITCEALRSREFALRILFRSIANYAVAKEKVSTVLTGVEYLWSMCYAFPT
jgi:hypothetical protein